LTEKQRQNVRKIEGDHLSQRRVSLYIKEDYIRQRMLNTIVDALKGYMPDGMLSEGIIKYGIKL
jgi:LysR family hydrogen peroxide-inducible transcriptional activator